MKHIFDHDGVLLDVQYRREADGIPVFGEIRLLDADYKPTGPDLRPMLEGMMVWTVPGAELGPLMNAIIEELPA